MAVYETFNAAQRLLMPPFTARRQVDVMERVVKNIPEGVEFIGLDLKEGKLARAVVRSVEMVQIWEIDGNDDGELCLTHCLRSWHESQPSRKPAMSTWTDLTGDDLIATLHRMHKYGGCFAIRIAAAGYAADAVNRQRLQVAFPELFERYGPDSDCARAEAERAQP